MLKNYFKIAFRNLRKNPLTTIVNILGLATGIAICLFIAVWVQRELSYDNFHKDAEHIFRLSNTFKSESESFSQAPCGPAVGAHLPAELPEVESTCRYTGQGAKLTVRNEHFFEEDLIIADSNFFEFFSFPLLSGKPSQVLSNTKSIVLTQKAAEQLYGTADPVGQTLTLDGTDLFTVTGIAAEPPVNSHIDFSVVVPMSYLKQRAAKSWGIPDIDQMWLGGWMYTYAHLRDPVEWKEAEQHLNEVFKKYAGAEQDSFKMSYTYHLQPMRDIHLHSNLRYDTPNGSYARVWIFVTVGLIVLLLACINYINLSTARSVTRAKETGVRKVIGAHRGHLVGQYLTESILLAAIATGIGILLFEALLPSFSRLAGQSYALTYSMISLLLFGGFIVLLGLLAGLYPALVLSAFRPAITLKGVFKNSTQGIWMKKGLVVFQFTATIVLLIGIMVIRQQMRYIEEKDVGFHGEAVVEVNFRGAPQVRDRYEALRNELVSEPGIISAALHSGSLTTGLGNGWTFTEDLEGNEVSTSAYRLSVHPDFFDTYGMEIVAGRFFSPEVATDTAKAVLVNEAAVRTFGWQKPENALGKRFGRGDNAKYVVGVVKDFNFETLHKPVEALIVHFNRGGSRLSLQLNLQSAKSALYHLEKTWMKILPEVPLEYRFVDAGIAERYGNEQKLQSLFVIFSSLSLFIACLGLFGLATMAAINRRKEISIRKVLGATTARIVGLLSKDFLLLVLIAFLIAIPISWYFINEWLQDFAYRITVQWWIFALAGGLALVIAFLTVSIQSIKAALSNPVKSLRSE